MPEIEFQIAGAEHSVLGRQWGLHAPQYGPHSGQQLAQPVGLGDEIIRARFKGPDLVVFGVPDRHHQDARLSGGCPQAAAYFQTAPAWHVDIQQHQVGPDLRKDLQRFIAASGFVHGEPARGQ